MRTKNHQTLKIFRNVAYNFRWTDFNAAKSESVLKQDRSNWLNMESFLMLLLLLSILMFFICSNQLSVASVFNMML